MRRLDLIICGALFAAALQAAPALAFDMPAKGKWWHDEQMVITLNLSQEQSRRIDGIFYNHRKEFLQFSTRLKKNYLTLEVFLESGSHQNIDSQRLSKMVDEVHKARVQLEKSRLMMLLEVRRVLSRNQADMLKQMRRQMVHHMESMGMGGRPESEMGMRGR